jgi:hypothetical protein
MFGKHTDIETEWSTEKQLAYPSHFLCTNLILIVCLTHSLTLKIEAICH